MSGFLLMLMLLAVIPFLAEAAPHAEAAEVEAARACENNTEPVDGGRARWEDWTCR